MSLSPVHSCIHKSRATKAPSKHKWGSRTVFRATPKGERFQEQGLSEWIAAYDVSCHVMQNRNTSTSSQPQSEGTWSCCGQGPSSEAGGSPLYVSPSFVLVCAHAKHFVNILDCQGAVLWSNYCCATADSANFTSPLTKQCCYECTDYSCKHNCKDFLSSCVFLIILFDHTQKHHCLWKKCQIFHRPFL